MSAFEPRHFAAELEAFDDQLWRWSKGGDDFTQLAKDIWIRWEDDDVSKLLRERFVAALQQKDDELLRSVTGRHERMREVSQFFIDFDEFRRVAERHYLLFQAAIAEAEADQKGAEHAFDVSETQLSVSKEAIRLAESSLANAETHIQPM